ncbi:hypothetical protein EYC80_007424 [Monilinia laxa]|uniref:Major facilitator superfamily (MFS) profile domain-containing protein n=1 Tax=Monilinia laxa TaxID=61186 RepID=A0A5N6JV39_MONLA|nr:hypothetical protein EYC80_007424 [Monilinia laxa]
MVEATCWPGLHFMIGSWYRNHEINKRSGFFAASGIAATIFSGYIQAGIYTSMNGASGLAGWRWLFIIGSEDNSQLLQDHLVNKMISDFVISLPLLVFGIIFIPDPITSKDKSWWMTYREKELAVERLALEKGAPVGKLDLPIFKRVLGRWRFWIMNITFSLYYFFYQAPTTSTMTLWLKTEETYSIPQINNLPTVYSAISIIYMIGSGIYNDYTQNRLPSLLLIDFCNITAEAILVAWFVPKGVKYFAFWLAGTIQATTPIIVSWTNEVCSRDAEERAIVVASLNSIGAAQGAWWNQVFVKTTSAPRFKLGYRMGLGGAIAMTAWLPVVEYFDRRQKREAMEGVTREIEHNDGSRQGSVAGRDKTNVRTTSVES